MNKMKLLLLCVFVSSCAGWQPSSVGTEQLCASMCAVHAAVDQVCDEGEVPEFWDTFEEAQNIVECIKICDENYMLYDSVNTGCVLNLAVRAEKSKECPQILDCLR